MLKLKAMGNELQLAFYFLKTNKDLFLLVMLTVCCFAGIILLYCSNASITQLQFTPLFDNLTATLVSCYFSLYFTGVFFHSALIACVTLRLQARKGSLLQGLYLAVKATPALLVWTLFSATIGCVYRIIAGVLNSSDHFIIKGLGFIVELIGEFILIAMYYLLPVIVIHNYSLSQAIAYLQQQNVKSFIINFSSLIFNFFIVIVLLMSYLLMDKLLLPYGLISNMLKNTALLTLTTAGFSISFVLTAIFRSAYYLHYVASQPVPLFPASVFENH